MPSKPDEGFVIVKGAGKSYYPALRHNPHTSKQKIAHYPPHSNAGVWSSPRVAKTFIKIPWASVHSSEEAKAAYEREISLAAERAETDRLCRPVSYWSDVDMFKCIACGSLVWDRGKHLKDHQRKNLVDPAFHQTVELLFGDMAISQQASRDAAQMLKDIFGGD